MSDFYKIKRGGGYPRSVLSGQISPFSLLKCKFTTPKIAEIGNFWYKFAKNGKIWLGGGIPRFAPSCQISSLWVKKCGSTAPKIAKIGVFWYKFAQKGYTPLSEFLQIWLGDGLRYSHPHAKFYRFSFINVGLRPKTSPKMVIFGINLPKECISP